MQRLPMARRPAPSSDALRLIVSGLVYLLAVSVLVTGVLSLVAGASALPTGLFADRDLVALFGWVGLTISGVSVITIPTHLGVALRPAYLARLHFAVTNIGLVGFLGAVLVWPAAPLSGLFLAAAATSFLLFRIGVLVTVGGSSSRGQPAGAARRRRNTGTTGARLTEPPAGEAPAGKSRAASPRAEEGCPTAVGPVAPRARCRGSRPRR